MSSNGALQPAPRVSNAPNEMAKALRDPREGDRNHLDRWLSRWLVWTNHHFVLTHLAVAIGLTVLLNVMTLLLAVPGLSAAEAIGSEVFIVLVALSVPVLLTTLALRKPLRSLYSAASMTPPIVPFLAEALHRMHDELFDLRTHGSLLTSVEVSQWVRRCCFGSSAKRYIGTDTCTPSEFLKRYTGAYLHAHGEYLERTQRDDTVRIILADLDTLAADARRSPKVHADYVAWHHEHAVALLHVPPEQARVLAKRHQLVGVSDVTMWIDDFVLTWDYEGTRIRIRLGFADEVLYDRSAAYLRDLLTIAQPYPVEAEFRESLPVEPLTGKT